MTIKTLFRNIFFCFFQNLSWFADHRPPGKYFVTLFRCTILIHFFFVLLGPPGPPGLWKKRFRGFLKLFLFIFAIKSNRKLGERKQKKKISTRVGNIYANGFDESIISITQLLHFLSTDSANLFPNSWWCHNKSSYFQICLKGGCVTDSSRYLLCFASWFTRRLQLLNDFRPSRTWLQRPSRWILTSFRLRLHVSHHLSCLHVTVFCIVTN